MKNFLIRRMKSEDAESISRIYHSIIRASNRIDFKRIIEEQDGNSGFAAFVAEHNGYVIGYMISYIISVGFGIGKSAWITMLGVDQKFMGQGVGRGIAIEAFKYYKERGINNIYTTVEWDSTDMLSFFWI